MPVTLFGQNVIETAALTSTPADSADRLARLIDRAQSVLWTGASGWGMAGMFSMAMGMATPAAWILDVDLGPTPPPVTGTALVNQNIGGVTVAIEAGNAFPPATPISNFDPAGALHLLRTWASQTLRYWRMTIPSPAVAPSIGEWLLGVPRVIGLNPVFESASRIVVGNVRQSVSPAGYVRSVRRGAPRVRLAWAWEALDAIDEAARAAAYQDTGEGNKALLVQDEEGTLRWMRIVDPESDPRPALPAPSAAHRLYASKLTLEEALL